MVIWDEGLSQIADPLQNMLPWIVLFNEDTDSLLGDNAKYEWPDSRGLGGNVIGIVSWFAVWCLVFVIAANEGTLYEADEDSLESANGGIDQVVVSGCEIILALFSISMQDVYIYFSLAWSDVM